MKKGFIWRPQSVVPYIQLYVPYLISHKKCFEPQIYQNHPFVSAGQQLQSFENKRDVQSRLIRPKRCTHYLKDISVKGVSSKTSGNMIVDPIFCFWSQRLRNGPQQTTLKTDKSGLSFFNFQLFHQQKQVLKKIIKQYHYIINQDIF